jgi:hypothetical protein
MQKVFAIAILAIAPVCDRLVCRRGAGADAAARQPVSRCRHRTRPQRSLLDPSSQMIPINRPVRLVGKDGTIINGRLNEDTHSIQVIDDSERLHSILKVDLREYTISKTSPMPSYKDALGSEDISDLIGYLLSLKGP